MIALNLFALFIVFKRTLSKVKGHHQESEKTTHRTGEILANHVVGNDPIPRIYKGYFQFSNKSQSLNNKYCMILKIVNHMKAVIPGTGGSGGMGNCSSICVHFSYGFPGGPDGKETACHVGDPGLIPGSGRSPGEGHGNPLQYSCL